MQRFKSWACSSDENIFLHNLHSNCTVLYNSQTAIYNTVPYTTSHYLIIPQGQCIYLSLHHNTFERVRSKPILTTFQEPEIGLCYFLGEPQVMWDTLLLILLIHLEKISHSLNHKAHRNLRHFNKMHVWCYWRNKDLKLVVRIYHGALRPYCCNFVLWDLIL